MKILRHIVMMSALLPLALYAGADEDFCGWASLNLHYNIMDDLKFWFRSEHWFREGITTYDQGYHRFGLSYRVAPFLTVGPGGDYFEQRTTRGSATDFIHRRYDVFVQGVLNWQIDRFKFILRERYTYGRYLPHGRDFHDGKCPREKNLNKDFLRTKLTIKYMIDECPFTPFVASEIFHWDTLTMGRGYAGVEWKFKDHHSIELYYARLSRFHPSHRNQNAIAIDYTYVF